MWNILRIVVVVVEKATVWNICRFVVVVVVKEADTTSKFKGMSQLMWAFLKIVVISSRPNPRMKELPTQELCCWNCCWPTIVIEGI
mgnify:CR=1 FL=1